MSTCPQVELLKQLLAGELAEQSERTVYDHVGDCVMCQTALERLSEDTAMRQWHGAGAGKVSTVEPGPGFDRLLEGARGAAVSMFGTKDCLASPSSQPLLFLAPPRRAGDLGMLGPYPVEAELGRGGMGIVFRAFDESLKRAVAVKVLKPELAQERARARFVREAQAAAQVRHDHVVSVFAVASPADGPPYLVMEYLAGPTLAELIREKQRLEPRQAATLCAQVADGLAAAHATGLVHRDIKPANIILDDVTGRAKITDFGLARSAELLSEVTQEGVLAGTPSYMSPEQARESEALDARSDIYSLGVTLYEALTGELPFRGTPQMVLRQVVGDEPRSPRRLNDAVPRDLETICLKAMAKEPHRRYSSAADFRDDLRRWLGGEPIRARRIGPVGRLLRWVRREPVRAGLLAALLLALAGALGQWWRAERSADDAAAALQEADEQFARAARAADSFYSRMYQEGLLGQPISPEVREALMEDALAFYRSLPESRRRDPTMRAGEAEAHFRLGWVLSQMQRPHDALDALRRAVPLYEALLKASPNDARLARGLADCHFHAGRMYNALGDADGALRSWGEARDLLSALTARDPSDVECRRRLAGCFGNLAAVYSWNDEPDEARRACVSGRSLLEALLAESADESQRFSYRFDLLYLYRKLGDLDPSPEEAARWQQRGYDLADAIGKQSNWTDSNLCRLAALNCEHLGLAKARLGRNAEAVELLQSARVSLAGVRRFDKRLAPLFDGCQADCCLHLGDVQLDLGRPDDAVRSWEEARVIYERLPAVSLPEKEFRENLARTHLHLGDLRHKRGENEAAAQSWRQARDVWDALLKDYPDHPRLRRERAALTGRMGGAP